MRYVMKQKFWSLGGRYAITNEDGQDVLVIEGRLGFGDSLGICDPLGVEVARIERGFMSSGYKVFRNGDLTAIVRRKLALFRTELRVELTERLEELVVEGDFSGHEYVLRRDGEPVAVVSKAWFTWADSYGIDVIDFDDTVLILACAVVIDLMQEGGD
jgi:uncharacterized protein YxjI